MRFKVTFEVDKTKQTLLPASYQYELSSWIYKSISSGNQEYASWLHTNGFSLGHKQFKLFTFSLLNIPRYTLVNNRIDIQCEEISFILSFLPEQSTEEFIKGAFKDVELVLGDKSSQIHLSIKDIERLPQPEITGVMEFFTLSPIVLSVQRANGSAEYLSPADSRALPVILNNLKQKYTAFFSKEPGEECNNELFELITEPKPKLITIKANTVHETKVKAYQCKFKLGAQPKLIRIAYEAGLGEKNSMGFGCLGLINR